MDQGHKKKLEEKECAQKEECVCFNLRKAARVITQLYDEAMRPTGFRATQLTILVTVMRMEPVSVTDLAEATLTDRTTISRNFKPLEKRGLIAIRLGQDRRSREVVLTSRGREILNRVLPYWKKAQGKVAQTVGRGRLDQLLRDLSDVLDEIRKM